MQEILLQSLGQEDLLEKESTVVFLPEKVHGQRSLAGYSPGSRKEPDMTSTHITWKNTVFPKCHVYMQVLDGDLFLLCCF